MSVNMHKLNDVIEHYKRNINRATESNDNEKITKCLTKLGNLPITVQNLQKTGIGRVVNSLRKYDGSLGELAKSLVIQWKNVVKIEESENIYHRGDDQHSDEEHQDVSSTNDIEDLQTNQSINITSSVASTSYYNNNNSCNEPEISDENNADSSDHESSHHRHHDKSKSKKSKKDKDSRKRKESNCTSTDDQGDGYVSKKVKKEHKYENDKSKLKSEKSETATTSHKENNDSSKEYVKKDKKSSHSDKKKDKCKSTHKSESKSSHKDKHESRHESKSIYKDKDRSDSKKKSKDKKEESKPSTSTTSSTSTSCKTFEEALLGVNKVIGKKKQFKSRSNDRSSSSDRDSSPIPENMILAPLNLDPEELTANYKPLPQLDIRKKKMIDDIDPLATIMTTKNMRTKVYSGNKSTIYTEVPRLIDLCIQTIKDNIDALEYTGGVPFIILEPILKHTNPDQLYQLEHYNDYLIEDTDGLWEYHCKKEFRNKIPEKKESWRNFYIRCLEERELKLAKLRKNINANQAASTPVRKTQLAYVDSVVKPPRGVARKQAKLLPATIDTKRNILNKSMMGENSTAQSLSANNRSTTMATGIPVALSSAHSVGSSAAMKKKKAPLMQKALQLIKSTRRR